MKMCPAAFWIFINSYSNVKWGASKQKPGGLFKRVELVREVSVTNVSINCVSSRHSKKC